VDGRRTIIGHLFYPGAGAPPPMPLARKLIVGPIPARAPPWGPVGSPDLRAGGQRIGPF